MRPISPISIDHRSGEVAVIDHVILTVGDIERSVAFYKKALAPLGAIEFMDYPGSDDHPHLVGFSRRNGNHFFWLKEGRPDPDAIHVGMVAESQEVVDAFYHAAIAAGGREKIAPSPQLHYHANYYATWVLDPDGHDIEVVNKTGRAK
jgi:catechol 2,3-dioxygenase-like lactoylglutathione lyase family enzyme